MGWLDEATLKEVLENRMFLEHVLPLNSPVYIVEEVAGG